MKKLFPLLLCYVLMTGQCFAISGGPVFGNGQVSTIGTYSGIIRGVTEANPLLTATSGPPIPGDTLPAPGTGTLPTGTVASNAIGLFDLVVPGTGTASGAFLLFADGRLFSGVIDASVDPSTNQLSGILNASFNIVQTSTFIDPIFGTSTSASSTTSATAVGGIVSKINNSSSSSRLRSFSLARLTGTAFMDINFGAVNTDLSPVINRILTFTVSGFKQTAGTSTSAVSALTGSGTGQNGAGGSGGGTAGGSGGG